MPLVRVAALIFFDVCESETVTARGFFVISHLIGNCEFSSSRSSLLPLHEFSFILRRIYFCFAVTKYHCFYLVLCYLVIVFNFFPQSEKYLSILTNQKFNPKVFLHLRFLSIFCTNTNTKSNSVCWTFVSRSDPTPKHEADVVQLLEEEALQCTIVQSFSLTSNQAFRKLRGLQTYFKPTFVFRSCQPHNRLEYHFLTS